MIEVDTKMNSVELPLKDILTKHLPVVEGSSSLHSSCVHVRAVVFRVEAFQEKEDVEEALITPRNVFPATMYEAVHSGEQMMHALPTRSGGLRYN